MTSIGHDGEKPMPHPVDSPSCPHADLVSAYALGAVASGEMRAIEAHVAWCARCRSELEALRPLVDAFAYWPTEVLRAPPGLQQRLSDRLWPAAEATKAVAAKTWDEPEWNEVGPGISCKLLTGDADRHRVGMLVRLAPGSSQARRTFSTDWTAIA